MSGLPSPFLPPHVDLRDVPIPREFFAQLAAETFGISYAVALRMTNEAANRVEGKKVSRKGKGRRN